MRKDKHHPGIQSIFYTFPELDEYPTKDLYKPHPSLPNHWMYYGRADNIIVFSNGEKLNPVTIEETVSTYVDLKAALVFGQGRFQAGLLLEPTEIPKDDIHAKRLIDRIWPLVSHANKETVAHGRIDRQFVILAKPEKPFPRAGKGTVLRASTLKLYQEEIDALYEQMGDANGELSSAQEVQLDVSSEDSLIKSIVMLFEISMGTSKLEPDTDLASVGIDSLQVINASRLLRVGLEKAGAPVNASTTAPRILYGNPTPRRLAKHLYSYMYRSDKDGQNGHHKNDDDDMESEIRASEALLSKYIQDMPICPASKPAPADKGQTVLLTGSTGSLGSYLLDFIESCSAVAKIICLNRSPDGGRARQVAVNAERGLCTEFTKTEFLHADLSRFDLGLDRADYSRLLSEADRIIHNAWPVNFNLSVDSFEPHIRGTRQLVDFSSRATKRVPIIFLSSIGTVSGWNKSEPIPETSLPDFSLTDIGYSRSKLVSSLILEEATKQSGVPTAIVRVGQIAGPVGEKGVWNRKEWLPTLIASSVHLGVLPDSLGSMSTVNWIPLEDIASLILEVSGVTSPLPISEIKGHFHGVNPSETTWDVLASAVREFYREKGRTVELVSVAEWIDAVERSATATGDISKNPAVKLLDTYRRMLATKDLEQGHMAFALEKTQGYSRTMRNMKAVTPELMRHWCQQWGF